jgi:hypothetical protein
MPKIAPPSVQSLFIQMLFDGQLLATGTGFVVQSRTGPVLITNRHNVTGRHPVTEQPLSRTGGIPNELNVLHNSEVRLGEWVPRIEPLYSGDKPLWIEHPSLKEQADFVALPLSNTVGVAFYPYDPANPGTRVRVDPGDIVSVVGFPFGIAAGGALAVWATGFCASEPAVDYNDLRSF